jgi:Tol biopolymer transport system component
VSVASDGTQGNAPSGFSALSADGRFVAFVSRASNLVPLDGNRLGDIFVRDRQTGTTERVSVTSAGTEGNGSSGDFFFYVSVPALSADGRFVAFASGASNLVAGDTNDEADIFVHDRQTGTIERVSVASDGTQGGSPVFGSLVSTLSADGRFVAFASDATNLVAGDTSGQIDVFVHDRETGATERVSVASDGTQQDSGSLTPVALSADGRFVAFQSDATNLVGDDTNGKFDVFVHDRLTGATERVSVASDGTEGNGASASFALSADGRFVAFASSATNLVAGDTNGVPDVFVRDRLTGTTERVSVTSDGAEGTGGSSGSLNPTLSADGRFVAFLSDANLAGDTGGAVDVFVHDRQTATTVRPLGGGVSPTSVVLSANGHSLAFDSVATDLVAGDTNGAQDVFVHDLLTTTTTSTTQPPTTTTTIPTTTSPCDLAQLPEDSLARVECAIGAMRATLTAPPQLTCHCRHCPVAPALDRIAGLVMQADGATSPKKCRRKLGKAGHAARVLSARVVSLAGKQCLAPPGRVAILASEVVVLATRTRALLESGFCASK